MSTDAPVLYTSYTTGLTCLYAARTVLLMGVLTEEQFEMIWEKRGLKHRIGRFRNWLVERNLSSMITARKLQEHFRRVLHAFLVMDMEETADGRQSIAASDPASYEAQAEIGDTTSEGRG